MLPGLRGSDHIGITVPDLEEATRFYVDLLGAEELLAMGPFDSETMPRGADGRDWTETHMDVPGASFSFRVLRLGGFLLELFAYERPTDVGRTPPRNWDVGAHHIGLRVENIASAVAYLRANGVRVLDGTIDVPEDAPGGPMRGHYFFDPAGNYVELVERYSV